MILSNSSGEFDVEADSEEEITQDTGLLTISSSVPAGIDSVSTGGVVDLLEGFLEYIGSTAEEAVSYVVDHIVSFLIGSAVLVLTASALFIFISIRAKPIPEKELVLTDSPLYMGPRR
jgi:hypothetical protein